MNKTRWLILGIIATLFIAGIYLYHLMPNEMASHWNASGYVDGHMDKFWGLFLMPLLALLMFGLFITITKIDPLKDNISKFMKYYEGFIFAIILFLTYVYALTIAWNLGFKFNMNLFLIPALSALFYYCGVMVEKAKRNWFIGIRTPWTLSSDIVWEKTHKLGGKLFKLCALISLIGMLFGAYALFFVLIPILISAVYLFAYSYFEYSKLNKINKSKKPKKAG